MATEQNPTGSPLGPRTPLPAIHEAELAPGLSGTVYWGEEIDITAAIARRQAGEDVVIRGDDLKANRALAQMIEAGVGAYNRGSPHVRKAGPNALPHFQQVDPDHKGHCFYETSNRRARKRP